MERILIRDLVRIARSPELSEKMELVFDIVATSAYDADWVTVEKIADLFVMGDEDHGSRKIARIKAAQAWFCNMGLSSAKRWVEANFCDGGNGLYAFN